MRYKSLHTLATTQAKLQRLNASLHLKATQSLQNKAQVANRTLPVITLVILSIDQIIKITRMRHPPPESILFGDDF